MDYDKFKSELKRSKISIKGLADILEMNPTSITNYRAKNEVPRHLALVAHMLAELTLRGYGVEEVKQALKH